MSERLELYKCNVCGNLIEVVLSGAGELVCCGEPMEYLEPNTSDSEYTEKHVPIFVTTDDNGVEVRVGSTLHPMTDEHYIQFIETIADGKNKLSRQYYAPHDIPIMVLKDKLGLKNAREFCNIHGLWEGYYKI